MATTLLQTRNALLRALPPNVLAELAPAFHPVSLSLRDTLFAPDAVIQSVYFVEDGWVSLVATLDDGAQAEVGLVGREGMVGLPVVAGVETAFVEAMVQGRGTALRMDAGTFRRSLDEEPILLALMLRYFEAMNAQTAQTAACNGRHGLEQRLARWLLMAHDRSDGDDLEITQEFLALMLCVYRPSVSIIARSLQSAGLIEYVRGHVKIVDRPGLEAASCDCYMNVRRRFSRLLGP
jgi:CRP-like cAMP-binding protein